MAAVYWITSYPRSGNTWMRFMLASYFSKKPVQTADRDSLNALLPPVGGIGPGNKPEPFGVGDNLLLKDRLILKTHALPDASALAPYRSDTTKAIYIVRNPRDVMLSLMRYSGMDLDIEKARTFAMTFIENQGKMGVNAKQEWGGWAQHILAWTTPGSARQYHPNVDVLPVRYEDLRTDAEGNLTKVLDFLGLDEPVVPEDVARAVGSSSLDRMRAMEAEETGGKGRFNGEGLQNQSLAHLGEEVEEAYMKLVEADNDFSCCVRKFGYAN